MTQERLDQLEDVAKLLAEWQPAKMLIVADHGAYQHSGAAERLSSIVDKYETTYFDEFQPNPQAVDAEKCSQRMGDVDDITVLVVGGGSAIDIAKLACHLHAQGGLKAQWWSRTADIAPRRARLIAVPTTAGTGSEATHFAVVYASGEKHSVAHASLLPNVVVLDASLTASLPAAITAASGLDAITQAIESLWAKHATEESLGYAREALALGLANLERAVNAPEPSHRQAMLDAAHLSGKAINISRTTAAHALSYRLTSKYGVPHGFAVALCLLGLLRDIENRYAQVVDSNDPLVMALAAIAREFGSEWSTSHGLAMITSRWVELLKQVGCPTSLTECGVSGRADREALAHAVNAERLGNHPVPFTTSELASVLGTIR
jgi:alcohol dehydrogenase class IV